jgi:hypothetical protein
MEEVATVFGPSMESRIMSQMSEIKDGVFIISENNEITSKLWLS